MLYASQNMKETQENITKCLALKFTEKCNLNI